MIPRNIHAATPISHDSTSIDPAETVVGIDSETRVNTFLTAVLRSRPPWMTQAVCANHVTDFFAGNRPAIQRATQICQRCQVRLLCLDYALDHDERFGVWGGDTATERRELVRRPTSISDGGPS